MRAGIANIGPGGFRHRSLLETKLSRFFDSIGWTRRHYEPFELDGWIPDFLIEGDALDLLVEVKPLSWSDRDGWERETAELRRYALDLTARQRILLVGLGPNTDDGSILSFGRMIQVPYPWVHTFPDARGERVDWYPHLCPVGDSWDITFGVGGSLGLLNGREIHVPSEEDVRMIRWLWARACNDSQWSGMRWTQGRGGSGARA